MIIDCISDLHGNYPTLDGGDLLIVAGDLTVNDSLAQINRFKDWLVEVGTNLYTKTVMIAGNHDNWIQRAELFNRDKSAWEHQSHSYLEDSGTEFGWEEAEVTKWGARHLPGLRKQTFKIWGSPWTKTFPGINPKCKAFTVDTEEELAEKFALIPDDTDILIAHGPMAQHLDQNIDGYHCGSWALRDTVARVKPKLFVFGHIHECGGQELMFKHQGPNTWCINASIVNERYEPVNKPIRVIL